MIKRGNTQRHTTPNVDQKKWEQLRQAIISDDVKSLERLLVDKESLCIAFGRFPILSLAYLYSSHKIINKFEKVLSGVKDYVQVEENYEDYRLFKKLAKKSLRLYLNGQIVAPIEMSAILCDAGAVSAHLKDTQNLDRVKKIYRLTHNVEVKSKGNSIIIPRSKKPSFNQLVAVISIICICVVCLSGALVAMEIVPPLLGGEGTIASPIKIISNHLFELALGESNRYYTLEEDLVFDAQSWSSKEFKMHLNGQGHTLTIKGARSSAFIEKLSGSLVNAKVIFEDVGSELPKSSAFFANSVSGKIENVTFYFDDIALTANTEGALVSYVSTGTFSNVDLFTNGTINEVSALEETIIGTLLYKNIGVIKDCNVKYNLDITGDAKAGASNDEATSYGDAVFGGVVGLNNATIRNVKVIEGSTLTTNTLDIGGIAVENADKATITSSINYSTLTQETTSSFWSPNIGGITMRNYGKITSSTNNGAIVATTNQNKNNTSVILGGITTTNTGTIDKCLNNAPISGTIEYGSLNLGGIGYLNEGTISDTTNNGVISGTMNSDGASDIDEEARNPEHHVGGGFAVNNGIMSYFKNTGSITTQTASVSMAYVGGVAGLNNNKDAQIANSQNTGNLTANTKNTESKMVFVGGITAYLKGSLTKSFNLGSFTTTSEDGTVIAGGVIGFTEIQGYSGFSNYTPLYSWSNNYYLNDIGYEVGVGNYYVYEIDPFFEVVLNRYYAEGEDVGATPGDIDTIKNSGVYW